jgi:hypothetical protein
MFNLKISPMNWDKYRKENSHRIELPQRFQFGSVNLGMYLGEKLSKCQDLWDDLMHRMVIHTLCIYGPNDAESTHGHDEGHCAIHVDKNDKIKSIYFNPYQSHLYKKAREKHGCQSSETRDG